MTSRVDDTAAATPTRASFLTVLRDQRKTLWVAVGLTVAAFWIPGQLGEWRLAVALSIGILLGLANHLFTEFWLLRTITSGDQPTKATLIRSTIGRLTVLTVVAVGITILLWPDGVALLLGLAIFRLIALVMTTLPLLKELKSS